MCLVPLTGFARAPSARFASLGTLSIALALLLGAASLLAQTATTVVPKPTTTKSAAKSATAGPAWSELTGPQRLALDPLAGSWNHISEGQKRKWIALSQNYPTLSESERVTLRSRMTEWVALSPTQRNQARLNFARTKKLSAQEKQQQWLAYQALSAEQKKQLAARANRSHGAAPALMPGPSNKLAEMPVTRSHARKTAASAPRPQAAASAATSPTMGASSPKPMP